MLHKTISRILQKTKPLNRYTSARCTRVRNVTTVARCSYELELRFRQENLPEAICDIQFMIAHAIGMKTLDGVPVNKTMTESETEAVRDMAELRLNRMPVQYVIGEWDFRDLTLNLQPPVFIPRPETEELVEHILEDPSIHSVQTFLEIGPGSGAISLSLLKKLPRLRGTAIDRSKEACHLTEFNAKKLGLDDRLTVQHGDIGSTFTFGESTSLFDMVVSNPPYIPVSQMQELQPEIFLYEDHGALEAGHDGLDIVRTILKSIPNLVKPNSSIWFEMDSSHPEKIKNLINESEYQKLQLKYISTFEDFNSLPRFCQLVYKSS